MHRKLNPSNANSARILVGGRSIEQRSLFDPGQANSLQDLLDAGRQRFGHAICLCRKTPLKLQIRLRDGRYHLAVWPTEGVLHDARCHFFRDDLENGAVLGGQANVAQGGRPFQAHETTEPEQPGRQALRLYMPGNSEKAIASDRRSPESGANAKPKQSPTARAVNLKGLAVLLWREASLCKWHPAWERDWGRTRYELMQASKSITLNDTGLDSMVFVPRPYRETIREALNEDWDRFVSSLGRRAPAQALLIAPLKSYSEKNELAVVHLRHLRHPIGLSQAAASFVASECRNALRQVQTNQEYPRSVRHLDADKLERVQRMPDRHNPEVIGFFLVEASSRGGLWAKAAWMMSTHPTVYIPANNPNHVLLIDALVDQGYTFARILSDASSSKKQTPDWIVRHVLGPNGHYVPRAAIEIVDKGASHEFMTARAELAQKMAQQDVPTWYWMPQGAWSQRQVPPLPPHDTAQPHQAQQLIRLIQSSPTSDYCNGPSPHFNPERRVP